MTTDKRDQVGKSETFEKEVYEALRASGFHLQRSEQEVKDFVDSFGETKIELPESLADPDKLFDSLVKGAWGSTYQEETYALAARGQRSRELPKEVIEKMKHDILHGKKVKGQLGKDGGRKKKQN